MFKGLKGLKCVYSSSWSPISKTLRPTTFPVAAARLWNSLQSHVTAAPLSPSLAVVLNHILSHFLIPLSDSHLYNGRAVTRHFGEYNRYYV